MGKSTEALDAIDAEVSSEVRGDDHYVYFVEKDAFVFSADDLDRKSSRADSPLHADCKVGVVGKLEVVD